MNQQACCAAMIDFPEASNARQRSKPLTTLAVANARASGAVKPGTRRRNLRGLPCAHFRAQGETLSSTAAKIAANGTRVIVNGVHRAERTTSPSSSIGGGMPRDQTKDNDQ
jgi:hypothetical protein